MFSLKFSVRLSRNLKINKFWKRHNSHKTVRVRFAPSPTGLLHLGGLRTALYNHLFAKLKNGVSILRIDDTDQARKVDQATEKLIEDLAWCGIEYDEGPYFQSERLELYQNCAKQLVEQGDAYYCFCGNARLELLRVEALKAGEVPRYDNNCRYLSKEEVAEKMQNGEVPCIRFKLSSSSEPFDDLIHGSYMYDTAAKEGDPVILKKDGYPTYHFSTVVDDHDMNITHVLRGVEWQMSTPKHILLFKALKWEPPLFGHLPLMLNRDGTKLSKRQGGIDIQHLRQNGFFPNTLINFIVRFGGGFDMSTKILHSRIYSIDELAEKFDISRIKSASCRISLEHLMDYNQLEIRRMLETEDGTKSLVKAVQEIVSKHFQNSEYEKDLMLEDDHVKLILDTMKIRINKLQDLVSNQFSFLWFCQNKWTENDEVNAVKVEKLASELSSIDWEPESFKEFFKKFSESNSLKYAKLMKALRLILIGAENGPGVAEIMEILGRQQVQHRLTNAVVKLRAKQS